MRWRWPRRKLPAHAPAGSAAARAPLRRAVPLPVLAANAEELAAHEAMLAVIAKASGGRCLWASIEPYATEAAAAAAEAAPQRSSA